jgi:hypothetical protein
LRDGRRGCQKNADQQSAGHAHIIRTLRHGA